MHVGLHNAKYGPKARWRPLAPGSTKLGDGFWTGPQRANRKASLRHGYEQLEKAGNFHDLALAAGKKKGKFIGKVFWDSDVYKWLEAIAYELAKEPDAELRRMADEAIDLVEAAQQQDGYLNSYYTVPPEGVTVAPGTRGADAELGDPGRRWQDISRGHELYCAGHLFEAAIAFKRFLGEDRLIKVALKFAEHIDATFGPGPGKRAATPGHPEIELALVELYRETGEKRWLALAQFFVDQRGRGLIDPGIHGGHGGPGVYQDHVPVRDATSCEGHAVRQLYLTTGVTDIWLETGETALLDAMHRLWDDLTCRKTFVHGGAGQIHNHESFSEPYELPNSRAYCETCAQIATMMWDWRLLLGSGDGIYADSFETVLYNAFLSGVSLDGTGFFYVNTLLSKGTDPVISRKRIQRMAWPWTPCCPPNVMRFIALLEHYIATTGEGGLQLHQYIPSTIETQVGGATVKLALATRYPWNGSVRISVDKSGPGAWPLKLRVPAWSGGATIMVNGAKVDAAPLDHGYATIHRTWKAGDTVELAVAMSPALYEANPRIDSTANAVAIKRGPVVYCLEQADQEPGVDVLSVQIDEHAGLSDTWEPGLLGGVVTVGAEGFVLEGDAWKDRLYRKLGEGSSQGRKPARLKAIPYYAWANRGPNAMRIWIPRARVR
jgi:uncharacterized protein